LSCISSAQAKSGIENYNLLSRQEEYVWMPVLHYQTRSGVYAELRYNYEDINTVSLFGGKTINGGKAVQFSITPMVGFSAGTFTGVSVGLNGEAEWKDFYLSAQSQYSVGTKQHVADFFFNWSEAGYAISGNFFGGVAFQYTRQTGVSDAQPGFVAGFTAGNFSLPVYLFSPFKQGRSFIVGLNYDFDFKRKR